MAAADVFMDSAGFLEESKALEKAVGTTDVTDGHG